MKKNKFLLVDGNNLLFRAFFAQERFFKTKKDFDYSCLYLFIRMIISLINKNKGNFKLFAIIFDSGRKTFRHKKFKFYKANRLSIPAIFKKQFPLVFEWLKLSKIRFYFHDNYEADDIIATIFSREKNNFNFEILSSDHDLYQLLEKEKIKILHPKIGVSKIINFGYEDFLLEFGFEPQNFIDYRGLVGDYSDNLPGIKMIGKKTAQKLIKQFSSLDVLFLEESISLVPKKIREKLVSGKTTAFETREMCRLVESVPLELKLEECLFDKIELQSEKLYLFYQKYSMKSLCSNF